MAGLQGMLPTVSRFIAKQSVSMPQTRGGQRGLYPRVPRAYDGYITLSGFVSSHNLKIILPARPGIKLCGNCTAKRAGGYCFISLMW